MKAFSVILGKSKIEFSVWKVDAGYEARVNDMVIYSSPSYSACSEAISDTFEFTQESTNVFTMSGAVH